MATASLISVSEYLSTVYEPDCDYVEGELQERNVGETAHSFVQSILVAMFNAKRRVWNVVAGTEMRVQVAPDRFRIPDVCVQRRSDPHTPVVTTPPFICVEVLSPDDRLQRMQERIDDYTHMGVEHIWLVDSISRKAWTATADGSLTSVPQAFVVAGTPIRISLAELFAELDDMMFTA